MSLAVPALSRIALAAALAAASSAALAQSGEVNVYSYREQKLIQPLFDAFTKDTGIKVNVVSASSGLEQRIATEGANSPADVLLTVDVARLQDAVTAGIAQPIKSATARQIGARAIPRPERPLVRHLDARARSLRVQGPREGHRHHL